MRPVWVNTADVVETFEINPILFFADLKIAQGEGPYPRDDKVEEIVTTIDRIYSMTPYNSDDLRRSGDPWGLKAAAALNLVRKAF